MDNFIKITKFIIDNRRIIGVIVGSTLTLIGYADFGNIATKVGEI